MSANSEKNDKLKNDFSKILLDFCKDLLNTFPEIHDNMDEELVKVLNGEEDGFKMFMLIVNEYFLSDFLIYFIKM